MSARRAKRVRQRPLEVSAVRRVDTWQEVWLPGQLEPVARMHVQLEQDESSSPFGDAREVRDVVVLSVTVEPPTGAGRREELSVPVTSAEVLRELARVLTAVADRGEELGLFDAAHARLALQEAKATGAGALRIVP